MGINVIIMGKNDLGVGCSEILLRDPDINILGIIGHKGDREEDGWQKSLIKFAVENNIPLLTPKKVSREDLKELSKEKSLDILFSFQYEKIIKEDVLSFPEHGCVNLHFSLLPRNRGMYTIAWTLLEGDKEAGVTMHYMDEGIDTGDIIAQSAFKIEDEYNAQDIYEMCNFEGIKLLQETIPRLKTKKYLGVPQDEALATYHPLGSMSFKDPEVDWNSSGIEISRSIRAYIFPIFQYPSVYLNGEKLFLSKISLSDIESDGLMPGEFAANTIEDGIIVATRDKKIIIERFNREGNEVDALKLWIEMNYPSTGRFDNQKK